MNELLANISEQSEQVNIILLIGIAIFTGSVSAKVTPDVPLAEAFERTKHLDLEHLPVVNSSEDDGFIGVLNCRAVRRSLSAEVLSRQQKADSMA